MAAFKLSTLFLPPPPPPSTVDPILINSPAFIPSFIALVETAATSNGFPEFKVARTIIEDSTLVFKLTAIALKSSTEISSSSLSIIKVKSLTYRDWETACAGGYIRQMCFPVTIR